MKCKQILGSSKGHEVIKVSHFVSLHIFKIKSIKFCVCVCVCVCMFVGGRVRKLMRLLSSFMTEKSPFLLKQKLEVSAKTESEV